MTRRYDMSSVVSRGRRGVGQCAAGINRDRRTGWRVSVSVPRGNGPCCVTRTGLEVLQVQLPRIATFTGQPGKVNARIGQGDGVVVDVNEGLAQVAGV